ncbi:MAG TPA: hypothetical protein VFR09_05400, partial [Alphaproteobacteria bacterium]|nr:hypothetical protein [Alphaproteobacteria bacterium]
LQLSSGAALVFEVKKVLGEAPYQYFRGVGMRCALFASLSYALKHDLPIKATVGPLEMERGMDAAA